MYISPEVSNKPFYFPTGKVPNTVEMAAFINAKKVQNASLNRLEEYYLGKQDILSRVQVDVTQPNNKVVTNYCQMVVDFYTAYLLGKPIQYKSSNDALLTAIKEAYKYTDAHDVDVMDNQLANIMGGAAEQVYVDSKGKIRFTNVDYRNVVFLYNKDIENELNSVIKFYKFVDTDSDYMVELWTPTSSTVYKMNETLSKFTVVQPETGHVFGQVPFIEYLNNDYRTSSFAGILTLQDAYNIICSLGIDDYEAFVDSFLGIYNAAGTTDDDIAAMKTNRVLLLDGESHAEWITKKSDPTQIEEIKSSLVDSMHKIASVPDLTDQNFSSNASGVAIKYKMIGAENKAAKQERKFTKGLQRRLEIVTNFLNFTNSTNYEYTDVEIVFNRNMVGADLEIAQMVQLIAGAGTPVEIAAVLVKKLASQLSFITDADISLIDAAMVKAEANADARAPVTPSPVV